MKKMMSLLTLSLTIVGALAFTGTPVHAADGIGSPMDSTADFSVIAQDTTDPDPDPDEGKLVLTAVPDFSFGEITAKEIYQGFNTHTATTNGALSISDNRLGVTDWALTTSMTEFSRAGIGALTGAVLNLNATGPLANIAANVNDQGEPVDMLESDGSQHGVFNYNFDAATNNLAMNANGTADLAEDGYTSTLTWTLTSEKPVASTL